MAGLHNDGQAVRLGFFLDQVGQLHHRLLLDLWPPHDPLRQPGVLGQANDVGMLVGHHANPDLANDRAEMVAAGTAHNDGPDDHQFVQMPDIGKLGDAGAGHIAAAEHLIDVHLGDPARGVVGVVVVLGIDHQAVEHTLHLDLDFVQQFFQLARRDKLGNIVIGVETLARGYQPLANLDGNRGSGIGI